MFGEFDWALLYSSVRQPVMGEAAVATSQPLATQAGIEMLRRGGTAADAAVATAIAMTVLEPTTNAIGSDAFCLYWDGERVHGLNASGHSPAALTPERFAGAKAMPVLGWDTVTVPGAVSAWVELWRRFGKLDFEQLFGPAVHYAREGFPVAPLTAALWANLVPRFAAFPEWQRVFAPGGRAPQAGERIRFPDHAATLEAIAVSQGASFYSGDIAEAIAATAREDGALLNARDLAEHAANWVEPVTADYHGVRLHEIPPNGQGIAALIALSILRQFDLDGLEADDPEAAHLAIEAMKLAFAEAHREIADPRFMRTTPAEMLAEGRIAAHAARIDRGRAQDFDHGPPNNGGTILLCTADANGHMASFIQSQYNNFGSGIVVPGRGIALQNRGANFTLRAGHPNQVGGGKRPYHTIIPGLLTSAASAGEREEALMAFGVMGGFMQPQGQLQVLLRMARHGWNPQAALDAPRWQVTQGLEVRIEPGFDASYYEALRRKGHVLNVAERRAVLFGRGQVIARLPGGAGYAAGTDLRGDGQAAAI